MSIHHNRNLRLNHNIPLERSSAASRWNPNRERDIAMAPRVNNNEAATNLVAGSPSGEAIMSSL
jgi:hypothetical protein